MSETKKSPQTSTRLTETLKKPTITKLETSSISTTMINSTTSLYVVKPTTKPKPYTPEIIISPTSFYIFQFSKNSLNVKCHINCFTSNEYDHGDLGLYKESPNLINYDLHKCSVSLKLHNLQQFNSGKYGCRTFSSNPSSKDFYVNIAGELIYEISQFNFNLLNLIFFKDIQVVLTPANNVIYVDVGANFELKCSVLVTSTSFHASNDYSNFSKAKSLFEENIQIGSMLYRDSVIKFLVNNNYLQLTVFFHLF